MKGSLIGAAEPVGDTALAALRLEVAEPASATALAALRLATAFLWAGWDTLALIMGNVVLVSLPACRACR